MSPCCPAWLRVDHAVDFVAGVHPRFRRDRAAALLAKTEITGKRRMRELSKGMKTQVHLALTMAIDAKLLVLDEPTLGLDILARSAFYDALVNDYMDETRTILITTHQVEEVENLLTDVLFIDKGRIVLDSSIDDIAVRYAAVAVAADRIDAARAEKPFFERRMLGKVVLYFEQPELGEARRPRRGAHAQRRRSIRRQAVRRCRMNTYIWLVRREFWENRAIWMIPAVLGGFMILVALFGKVDRMSIPAQLPSRTVGGGVPAGRRGDVLRRHVDLFHLVLAGLPVRRPQGPQHIVLEIHADFRHDDGPVQAGHRLDRHSGGVFRGRRSDHAPHGVHHLRACEFIHRRRPVARRPVAAAAGPVAVRDRDDRHLVPADRRVPAGRVRLGQARRHALVHIAADRIDARRALVLRHPCDRAPARGASGGLGAAGIPTIRGCGSWVTTVVDNDAIRTPASIWGFLDLGGFFSSPETWIGAAAGVALVVAAIQLRMRRTEI